MKQTAHRHKWEPDGSGLWHCCKCPKTKPMTPQEAHLFWVEELDALASATARERLVAGRPVGIPDCPEHGLPLDAPETEG